MFFFFFQAEDGIRDTSVTGVQTCALPIFGGGNTAVDCCRSSRRLGGEDVKVIVRSGFDEMKASPWEKEDAIHEGIPIINYHVPKAFTHENGRLTGVVFEKVEAKKDDQGRRQLVPTG